MLWTDTNLKPIYDGEPVSGPDGTQYPGTWPKAELGFLVRVAETAEPDRAQNVVTGWHIERVAGVPTQVWEYTPRTAEEIAAEAKAVLAGEAQVALDKSDVTILRCAEAGVAVPPEWSAYRRSLRAIAAGKAPGPLPERPAYPAGT